MSCRSAAEQWLDSIWELRSSDLPAAVVEAARCVLLDTFGLTVGARHQPISQKLAEYVRLSADAGLSTSLCDGGKVGAVTAAFSNGSVSHDLEIDDIHQGTSIHVAAVLVPAAIAVAEQVDASSDELLLALVRGYEVSCRIGYAYETEQLNVVGFHPTAVCGAIGAAAVSASLLKLPREQFRQAVYLAASLSSGTMACKTETDHYTKSFHCGVAARHGVVAALLAQKGSVSDDVAAACFAAAMLAYSAGKPILQALTDRPRDPFEITQTSFKLYPCCSHIHPLLDALDNIRQRTPVRSADVTTMKLALYPRGATNVGDHALRTHNARYAMAMALEHPVLKREFFTEQCDITPVLPLMERIELFSDPDLDALWPAAAPGIITLHTSNGEVLSERVDYRKGTPENPIAAAALRDKFLAVTSPIVGEDVSATLAAMILSPAAFQVRAMMSLATGVAA